MRVLHQSDLCTLILGDARDPDTRPDGQCDLLCTDPPYGVKWESGWRAESFGQLQGDDGTLDVPGLLAGSATPATFMCSATGPTTSPTSSVLAAPPSWCGTRLTSALGTSPSHGGLLMSRLPSAFASDPKLLANQEEAACPPG